MSLSGMPLARRRIESVDWSPRSAGVAGHLPCSDSVSSYETARSDAHSTESLMEVIWCSGMESVPLACRRRDGLVAVGAFGATVFADGGLFGVVMR